MKDRKQTARTYILVHGAWHGGWCWRYVAPLLQAAGHTVFAPDLPGHGDDHTPLTEVTFAGYTDLVVDLVRRAETPVVLVGHSLGGMVISQVAEECSTSIARLVYLTALLPRHGQHALQLIPAQAEPFPFLAEMSDQVARLELAAVQPFLYHDCPRKDVALAQKLLCPQSMEPLAAPVTLSQRFASVPRAYISCTEDRLLPPAMQQQMYTATPCEVIFSLPSSHSPFFSMPRRLAASLLTLAWMEEEAISARSPLLEEVG